MHAAVDGASAGGSPEAGAGRVDQAPCSFGVHCSLAFPRLLKSSAGTRPRSQSSLGGQDHPTRAAQLFCRRGDWHRPGMERHLQTILAGAGMAAAAAGIWWLQRRHSAGDGGGEPAAGTSSTASSKPTGEQLHMQVSTTAEAALTAKPVEAQQAQDQAARAATDAEAAAAAEAASRAAQEQAAAAAAARQVLSRATRNELIVHDMLLEGKEGYLPFLPPLDDASCAAPPRMAAGRLAAAAPASSALEHAAAGAGALPPPQEQQEQMEVQQAVVGTVEKAFWDALADGLRRGETGRLAALLLDARDQLMQLLPQSSAAAQAGQQQQAGGRAGNKGGSSSEGQALLADLMEHLDAVRGGRGSDDGLNARLTPTRLHCETQGKRGCGWDWEGCGGGVARTVTAAAPG